MSKGLRPSVLAAALLAVFASDLTRAQSSQVTLAGYPAPGSAPTVTLSSPGAEPRTRLRYKVTAGQSFAMTMAITMGMNMSMEGMSMPAMDMPIMKMGASMTIKDVASSGDITFDMAFTEMTAEPPPGMDPSIAAMMQAAAAQITQLKTTSVMTDRGVVKSGAVDLAKITDPNLRQTLSGVASQFESMSTPLPEEAVGVGAKWEVRQALGAGGMQMFQRVDAELVSVDASSVTIRLKLEQTTPPQSVSNPSLPAGVTVDVEKMTGTGTSTMTLRFDSLVPTSDASMTSSAVMVMNMGGQTQKMSVDTKAKITVGPTKK